MSSDSLARNKKEVFSSHQYRKLYHQLRRKSEVDHYPQFGNYKPKSLRNVAPEWCLSKNGVSTNKPRIYASDVTDINPSDARASTMGSPRVHRGNNVFLVGDKDDFITLAPIENGYVRYDRNNNSENDSLEEKENFNNSVELEKTQRNSPRIDHHTASPSASISHMDIKADTAVSSPDNGRSVPEFPHHKSHDYTDADFAQYLVDDEDSTMSKFPVVRPLARKPLQSGNHAKSTYNSTSALRGFFEKKTPAKNHASSENRNTVRDISFADSKLGLGSYSQGTLNTRNNSRGRYSSGSADADNFVNSHFTYENYLQSRCIERMSKGEMDTASANDVLDSTIQEPNRNPNLHNSAVDLTKFGKNRWFSYNSDSDDPYSRHLSPWKKFTMKFKRGRSIDELEVSGLYTSIQI